MSELRSLRGSEPRIAWTISCARHPDSQIAGSAFRVILFGIRLARQRVQSSKSKIRNCQGGCVMSLKQVLFSTVAAIGIAALGASALEPASAQPKPRTASITAAVAIDAD